MACPLKSRGTCAAARCSRYMHARNKKLGEAIVANDDVKLYYLGEGRMVSIWGNPYCDGTLNPPRPPASNSYTYYDTLEVYIA